MSVWTIAPMKLYLPVKPNQIENIFLQKFPSLIKLQRPDLQKDIITDILSF